MYQIAKKMCYLYDMYITHCDLKPKILQNVIEKNIMNKIVWYTIIIVINFGISKIDVGRNPKATKNNNVYISIN